MGKINVAIIGVGNCASSLVQGVHFYRDAGDEQAIPGIMHPNLGGYHIGDINFVAAFDIDANKVGKDLSEAIYTPPNNTFKFADVPPHGRARPSRHAPRRPRQVPVADHHQGARARPTTSSASCATPRPTSSSTTCPSAARRRRSGTWSRCSPPAAASINCIPVFIAREPYWQNRFKERNLPVIGDDVKSQVGATIVHRVLTRLFRDRGVRIDRMYQLNFGGNTDFLNMLERERLESKKISKTNAVTSQLDYEMPADDIHVGPSDYIPWLLDRKWCHIRMEGTTFGNVPLNLELKLEVWDSPNSAGVVIDAIRCCKLALDRGISGALDRTVVLLHEVAAQAVHRRPRAGDGGGVHRQEQGMIVYWMFRLIILLGRPFPPQSRLLLRPHHRRHLLRLLSSASAAPSRRRWPASSRPTTRRR